MIKIDQKTRRVSVHKCITNTQKPSEAIMSIMIKRNLSFSPMWSVCGVCGVGLRRQLWELVFVLTQSVCRGTACLRVPQWQLTGSDGQICGLAQALCGEAAKLRGVSADTELEDFGENRLWSVCQGPHTFLCLF